MRVLAPAKVNLFLRVVGRRSDGYHLLDSLMVPVSLCDEILIRTEIESGEHGQARIIVTCDDPAVPGDETNLVYKAAALLLQETGMRAKIAIAIHKRIPAGAGLGGGSSDAAVVLKSVNTLLSLGLSESQLCTLAAQLGADVPFFIPCRPARVAGIGEILTAVPALPARWLVITVPPFRVSTPWAYRRFDELPAPEEALLSPTKFSGHTWLPTEFLVNDLEQAVLPTYPLVGRIKDQLLRERAEGALMSGSGSAVFGIFQTYPSAEQAAQSLKGKGKTFVVEFLSEPPQVIYDE